MPLLTPDSLRDKPHCEKTWAGGARFSLSMMLYQPQPCLHPAVTTETPRSAQTPTSLPEGSSLERLQKMPLRPLLLARTSLEAQPQSLPQTHSKVCSLTHGSTDLYSPQRHTARAGPISPRPGWPRCPQYAQHLPIPPGVCTFPVHQMGQLRLLKKTRIMPPEHTFKLQDSWLSEEIMYTLPQQI